MGLRKQNNHLVNYDKKIMFCLFKIQTNLIGINLENHRYYLGIELWMASIVLEQREDKRYY